VANSVYKTSTNIPQIMNINRLYVTQNLLSLWLVSFLVGLRTYQHPCRSTVLFETSALTLRTAIRLNAQNYDANYPPQLNCNKHSVLLLVSCHVCRSAQNVTLCPPEMLLWSHFKENLRDKNLYQNYLPTFCLRNNIVS
jgi:hypothetical protein